MTMKTRRTDMGVAVIGDLIFIIGGWNNERGVVEEVEVMNTKTQTMETLTRNPTGRRGMGVGVVDDRFIWTFGGFDGRKVDDVIEMCDTTLYWFPCFSTFFTHVLHLCCVFHHLSHCGMISMNTTETHIRTT